MEKISVIYRVREENKGEKSKREAGKKGNGWGITEPNHSKDYGLKEQVRSSCPELF